MAFPHDQPPLEPESIESPKPNPSLGEELASRRLRVVWIPIAAGFALSLGAWLAVPHFFMGSPEVIHALQIFYGLLGLLSLLFVTLLAIWGSSRLKLISKAVAAGSRPEQSLVRGAGREAARLPVLIGGTFVFWSLLLGTGTAWRGHVRFEQPVDIIWLAGVLGLALGIFGGGVVGALVRLQIAPFTRVLSRWGAERWPGRKRRFTHKVASLCGLVALIPALLTGVVGYYYADRLFTRQLGDDILERLNSALETAPGESWSSAAHGAGRPLESLATALHSAAEVALLKDGEVLTATNDQLGRFSSLGIVAEAASQGGHLIAPDTRCLLVLAPLSQPGSAMLVRIPRQVIAETLRPIQITTRGLIAVTLVLSVLLGWASARAMEAPLSDMTRMTTRVARGDLADPGGRILTNDEFSEVTGEVSIMRARLADTVRRVLALSETIEATCQETMDKAQQVGLGSEAQVAAVTSVAEANEDLGTSLREAAETAKVTLSKYWEATEAGPKIDAEFDEIARDLDALSHEASEAAAAVAELSKGTGLVAEDVSLLSGAAERATGAAGAADDALGRMREHAGQAAEAARRTITAAKGGSETVRHTVEGIQRIREGSDQAVSKVEALSQRISKVDTVLGVIDEIAEKTNLLALNASIIAARAGEHGKSFAVVAAEIRDLATRTASSTREIAQTVEHVRRSSREVVEEIRSGEERVEKGVELAENAESSLEDIVGAAHEASGAAGDIAASIEIQSRNVSAVREEIDKVAAMASSIAEIGEAQARASADSRGATERIASIIGQINAAITSSLASNHELLATFKEMGKPAARVDETLKQQAMNMADINEENARIRDVALAAAELANSLDESARTLERAAAELATEVRYFRV